MDISAILADIGEHWHVYATMPLIAALIGYLTKRVAIEMMFRPLEFTGIRPFLGWQGVIPANSRRMATTAVDLLTRNLVDPQEIFARLDPEEMVKELETPLLKAVEDVTREVMETYQPRLWEMLPARAQRLLVDQVRAQAPAVVKRLLREVSTNIDDVLDVNDMLINAMVRDKSLTCRLIREVATPEFKFIARSGIYFGFVIGLVQFVAWALTKEPLIMPIFGFVTGFVTDWLALKMIFYPREPRGFGFFRWQGMFQKRRQEVAADYGALIADEVLTVRNVMEAVLTGPARGPAVRADHPRGAAHDRRADQHRQAAGRADHGRQAVPGDETRGRREGHRLPPRNGETRRELRDRRARRAQHDRRQDAAADADRVRRHPASGLQAGRMEADRGRRGDRRARG